MTHLVTVRLTAAFAAGEAPDSFALWCSRGALRTLLLLLLVLQAIFIGVRLPSS